MLLAAWSFETSRRLFQIGILLAGIGAGFIGLGAVAMVWRPASPPAPAPGPPPAPGTTVTQSTPAVQPAPAVVAAPPRRVAAVFVSPALVIASVLLVAGFVLMILAVHWGVSPFSPRR